MKKIVIVGATSVIAKHCAQLWLQKEPIDLILIGRDLSRLERNAADFRVRNPNSNIQVVEIDFSDIELINETVTKICALSDVDIVLIAHGNLPDQEECQNNMSMCKDALFTNGVSAVLFAEAFARQMEPTRPCTLALIGSVAGDRGRKSNYIYGAAKGMIARYVQGLQHRFAGTSIKIVLIKPGPTNTPMTSHLNGTVRMASAESVARIIVNGVESGKAVVYAPKKWWMIMMVIRHLPSCVFNKLNI